MSEGRFNTCRPLADSHHAYLLMLNGREGEAHRHPMAATMSDARAGGVTVPRALRVGPTRLRVPPLPEVA